MSNNFKMRNILNKMKPYQRLKWKGNNAFKKVILSTLSILILFRIKLILHLYQENRLNTVNLIRHNIITIFKMKIFQ